MKNSFLFLIFVFVFVLVTSCTPPVKNTYKLEYFQDEIIISNLIGNEIFSQDTFDNRYCGGHPSLVIDTSNGEEVVMGVLRQNGVWGIWSFCSKSFLREFDSLKRIFTGPDYKLVIFEDNEKYFCYQLFDNGQCNEIAPPYDFDGNKAEFWLYFANWSYYNKEQKNWSSSGTCWSADSTFAHWTKE